MAEGFEPYHIPQQSRRDKLRFLPGQPHQVCEETGAHHLHGSAAATYYDPTSISLLSSSDLLTCGGNSVKGEGHLNLMGYMNTSSASSSLHNFRNPYLDPQPSNFASNPSSVHDINNLFLYPSQQSHHQQHLRDFHEEAAALFKPEPLSLSLSSQPVEVLSLQRYGYSGISDSGHGSRSPGPTPLGPVTGYESILKGSRFLRPAQQLLEEFCDVGTSTREIYYAAVSKMMTDDSSSFLDARPIESLDDPGSVGGGDGGESRRKKSRLISMLDEVYRRYKQYYHQMQEVVTSFEYVAGLGNAAPYANLAIKSMTRHFKCLKNAIMDQLQYSRSSRDNTTLVRRDKNESVPMLRSATRGMYSHHRSFQSTEFGEPQPVWRPQRGLPERAVTVLRSWLFEHFLHPYPTDTDKIMLAKQTGLTRNQVSNWFINARVRLWKPMVEDIYMEDQAQMASQKSGDRNLDKSDDHDHLALANSVASENPSTSTYRAQDAASKRPRNEFTDVTVASTYQQLNMSYNNLPSHLHHVGHVGASMAGGSTGGGSVSLTLGLHHQNKGAGLSEPPYAITNTVQRFGLGLEGNSDGYTMGGFDAQNRHFGRDVMGGQLLHDFVG